MKNFFSASSAALLSVVFSFLSPVARAQVITVSPSSYTYSATYVGKVSGTKAFTVTNSGAVNLTIRTITLTCPQFQLTSGVAPETVKANGGFTHYSVQFAPDSGTTFNCDMNLLDNTGVTTVVPLTGSGMLTTAAASLSSTSVNFGNTTVGSISASQILNVTNTGGQSLSLQSVTPQTANFAVSSSTLPATISAGASFPLTITYSPTGVESDTAVLDLTYDSVPDNASDLNGTGIAATSVAITNLALLPAATQSSAYQVQLNGTGGVNPYTYSLATGSALPKGIKGSSKGLISGTLDVSVGTGNYTFTINVKDGKGVAGSKTFTFPVFAATGAACSNISFNIPSTTTPIVPLTDLGTGTYQGSQGGLYPNGSNVRPATTDADAVAFGNAITPLDSNGNPSTTGKIVLLSIGESTALDEFGQFVQLANADPQKNKSLVIVNGAQGGATPKNFQLTSSAYWTTILNDYLPGASVTPNQVQAVWVETTDGIASGTFPTDITNLQSEYEQMARNIYTLFPKIKIAYFTSRFYAGYSNGISTVNPEPYAFEVGYAVKWAIQDQVNGLNNLNYKSSNGTVVAPLIIWGPYDWTNGLLGRKDGLVWSCQDSSKDGTHPATTGKIKVASYLLNYFKTDTSTTSWYLQH